MKKFGKIVGISLGALIGLVLVVVSVAVWMVFTPSRLTPIVRQVADKIITCEYEIGEVELTFFSTFPEFGLRADTLCLINACEGAKADTILFAPQVVATVDVMSLWKDRHLNVRQLTLSNVEGYVYLSDSISNIEVLALAEDTVAADTTGFVLPFDRITVGALQLTAKKLVLDDRCDSIDAALYNTSIQAHMNGWEDMMLLLSSSDVCAKVGEEMYANHLSVGARLPLSIDTELRSVDHLRICHGRLYAMGTSLVDAHYHHHLLRSVCRLYLGRNQMHPGGHCSTHRQKRIYAHSPSQCRFASKGQRT